MFQISQGSKSPSSGRKEGRAAYSIRVNETLRGKGWGTLHASTALGSTAHPSLLPPSWTEGTAQAIAGRHLRPQGKKKLGVGKWWPESQDGRCAGPARFGTVQASVNEQPELSDVLQWGSVQLDGHQR